MSLLHVTIDGIPVEVEKGTTILEAAERVGVKIPTLCHIKGLMPDGSCRICTVEIQNRGRTKRTPPAPPTARREIRSLPAARPW